MSNDWRSAKHKKEACAHHRFSKDTIHFLWLCLKEGDRKKLREALYLEKQAGWSSITRGAGLLLSPYGEEGELVLSSNRTDDPDNNPDYPVSPRAKGLDWVKDKSSNYTVRSKMIIDYIHENYKEGIFENKFIFNVDKTKMSTCGCGISFTPL